MPRAVSKHGRVWGRSGPRVAAFLGVFSGAILVAVPGPFLGVCGRRFFGAPLWRPGGGRGARALRRCVCSSRLGAVGWRGAGRAGAAWLCVVSCVRAPGAFLAPRLFVFCCGFFWCAWRWRAAVAGAARAAFFFLRARGVPPGRFLVSFFRFIFLFVLCRFYLRRAAAFLFRWLLLRRCCALPRCFLSLLR